ncbi:MAG TPA: hypothetical protein VGM92_14175 [Candidatus Kapabacteria bacterium]|jgi:hypothetical protein
MNEGKNLSVIFVGLFLDKKGEFRINSVVAQFECDGIKGMYLRSEQFDVDYCEKFSEYIFNNSGSGPSRVIDPVGFYWASDLAKIKTSKNTKWSDPKTAERNPNVRLAKLPIDLCGHKDVLDFLQNEGNEDRSYYCSKCNDHLPEEYPCKHAWWCEDRNEMSTPGNRFKSCRCEACKPKT